MTFSNVYDDDRRAEAYAKLEFPGTYYLAYRDLPAIIAEHVTGRRALDFGCGAGRSTRFLKKLGFDAVGIDISASMIQLARSADPEGRYELVEEGKFGSLEPGTFDLVLSAFAFDNIPGVDKRRDLLIGLRNLLGEEGRIVLLGSRPEIYMHEWASFTTKDFPENRGKRSGETVQIIMKDVDDRRPVVDLIWFPHDYDALFAASGLRILAHHTPLGLPDEPVQWLTETSIAPWMIYVLGRID
jgi:SAM-dependent methyltransferase